MPKNKNKKEKAEENKIADVHSKKNALENKNNKRGNIILIIGGISIILLLILLNTFVVKPSITYSIAKDMISSKNSFLSKDTSLTEESEDSRFKHSFIACTQIYKGSKSEKNRIVSIALYDTKEQAKYKKEFFKKYNKYLEEKYKDTIMEEMYIGEDAEFVIIDNYFLNISKKYIDYKDEIIELFKKYEKNYEYKSKDKIHTKELDKYWEKQLQKMKKELDIYYNQKIEELKKKMKEDINNIKVCKTVTACKEILESKQAYKNYKELSNELNELMEEYNKKVIFVADFSTMSKQEVENWCKEKGILCDIKEEYSNNIANGGFIGQSKEANSEMLIDENIAITYSMGRAPTQSELNALSKAQSYSDHQYMSKNRLYRQLTSPYGEGFTPEEAQYAIDHVKADWNYNALQSGKAYYIRQNMSKSRVYQQLVSPYGEDFTPEQAQYAVDHLDD